MNKERRKWLQDVITELEEKRDELEQMACEEQEAYDNLPEGIQNSYRGGQISDNADNLDTAQSELDNIIQNLYEVLES